MFSDVYLKVEHIESPVKSSHSTLSHQFNSFHSILNQQRNHAEPPVKYLHSTLSKLSKQWSIFTTYWASSWTSLLHFIEVFHLHSTSR